MIAYFSNIENCYYVGANNFTPAIREYCLSEYKTEYTQKMDEHWQGKTKYENHYEMLLDAPIMTENKIYIVPPGKENGIFSHKWLGRLKYLKLKDLESLYESKTMDFTQVPEFFFQVFTSLPQKPKDTDAYIRKYLAFQNKYLVQKHSKQSTPNVIDLSKDNDKDNDDNNNTSNATKDSSNNTTGETADDETDQTVVDDIKQWQQTPSAPPSHLVESMFVIHLFIVF